MLPKYLVLAFPALGFCQDWWETTTSEALPHPTAIDGNNKGSGMCRELDADCKRAVSDFDDDLAYYSESRQVYSFPTLAFGAEQGCVAHYNCPNEEAYKTGASGPSLKEAYVINRFPIEREFSTNVFPLTVTHGCKPTKVWELAALLLFPMGVIYQ